MVLPKKLLAVLILAFGACRVSAQDDLLSLVENDDKTPKKVYATFKTIRIGNAQSIENVKKRHLDFRISHRFGDMYNSDLKNPINETFQSYMGFDVASDIRTSFDYGLTDRLQVGIGRSRKNKIIDGSMKWKLLQQTTDFSVPFSVSFFESVGYTHAHTNEDPLYTGIVKDFPTSELHRFSYFTQLIIACKISDVISLEVLPSYMYRNFIKDNINPNNNTADANGFFTCGIGGRIKITKRMSVIGDYFYNFAGYYHNNPIAFNPLALGVEIETGGHVFSLFFTNASGLIENNFIPYTTSTWTKGQVKFGFCISRTFSL